MQSLAFVEDASIFKLVPVVGGYMFHTDQQQLEIYDADIVRTGITCNWHNSYTHLVIALQF